MADEVEAVLLCLASQKTRCGSAVSHRHGGSGLAVGLRQQGNHSDDYRPNMHVCICSIVCDILWETH